ncbi:hypothetical protein HY642_04265 [Candidatus Woesearchaeota archaeon]|nr:hypothetical protein [Candidatus Woesearchaeota archaeon]
MKCAACKAQLATTFLGKIIGTYVKDAGKLHPVCFECQQKFRTKEETLAKMD